MGKMSKKEREKLQKSLDGQDQDAIEYQMLVSSKDDRSNQNT